VNERYLSTEILQAYLLKLSDILKEESSKAHVPREKRTLVRGLTGSVTVGGMMLSSHVVVFITTDEKHQRQFDEDIHDYLMAKKDSFGFDDFEMDFSIKQY